MEIHHKHVDCCLPHLNFILFILHVSSTYPMNRGEHRTFHDVIIFHRNIFSEWSTTISKEKGRKTSYSIMKVTMSSLTNRVASELFMFFCWTNLSEGHRNLILAPTVCLNSIKMNPTWPLDIIPYLTIYIDTLCLVSNMIFAIFWHFFSLNVSNPETGRKQPLALIG